MKNLNLIFDGYTIPGKRLYHYTNTAGFLGIIKTNKVWATDYRFMNDPSEHKYAFRIVKEVLEDIIRETGNATIQNLHDNIYINPPIASTAERGYYLLSLSEEEDGLDLWRFYGENGRGFAVGFEIGEAYSNGEINFISDISPKLVKVIYNEDEQKRIARAILNDAIEFGLNGFQLMFLLDYLKIKFKDPSYSNEKEWRIVYSPIMSVGRKGENIDFRESDGVIINFHTFQLDKISNIIIGPCRSDVDMENIHELLIKHHRILGEVKKSNKPFRQSR